MTYNGLGQYSRERHDPAARRPGESAEGHARRLAMFHRPDQQEQAAEPTEEQSAAWAAHRAQVDGPTGQGSGLFGRATPEERAQLAGGTHGFSGDQRIAPNGHLISGIHVPGGVAPAPVYRSQMREDQGEPGGSPLLAHMRGGLVEWH
jgi:hypothetical protein